MDLDIKTSSKTLPFKSNGHVHLRGREDKDVVVIYKEFSDGEVFPRLVDHLFSCGHCGMYVDADLEYSDDHVEVKTPCEYPNGLTTVITLEVPSGKVIFDDDLRPLYDWQDKDGHDPEGFVTYNSALGQSQAVRAMAEVGCAFGYVGNSSPDMYKTGDGTYVIANTGWVDDEDDEDYEMEIVPDGWEKVGSIVTDLWAYSVADYNDWVSKGGDPASVDWTNSVVEIPAGTYQFTLHSGEKGFDTHGWDEPEKPVIFADIRKLA